MAKIASNLFIRKAELTDAISLSELCSKTFSDTYSSQNKSSDIQIYIENNFNVQKIKDEISDTETIIYLAVENNKPIGYIKLTQRKNRTEISRLYVVKDLIGKGIGKQLLETARKHTKAKVLDTLYLVVWQKNLDAVEFYKKSGFIITGTTTFDWGTGKIDNDFEMELKF